MKLPIHQAATLELDEAIAYYEEEQFGLGLEFLDEVEVAVAFAANNPEAGEARAGRLKRFDVRCFVVRRFPYLVHVATIEGRREIVAVSHARRRPGYWRDRLT